MAKGSKIALGIGILAGVGGLYWFGIRNRKPSISFEMIDWINKNGEVKFGFVKNTFSLNDVSVVQAGKTFSNKYSLNINPQSGDKLVFTVADTKSGKIIETQIIDFKSKLQYNG